MADDYRARLIAAADPERNAAIANLIRSGHSYAMIAKQYGLSRERVRQIAAAAGVEAVTSRAAVRQQRQQQAQEQATRRQEKHQMEAAMKEAVANGASILAAGRQLGLSRSQTNYLSRKLNLGTITQHGRWRNHPRDRLGRDG